MQGNITRDLVTIYCLCDDFLKACGYEDDPQAKMSTAEVMTVALAASALFDNNQERCLNFLGEHEYFSNVLGKSRFNRRLHEIGEEVWQGLLWTLAEAAKACNGEGVYAVDSAPVPACDNMRISRCRLYRDKSFRGYCASKRRYYYGLKVHLLVSATGQPVEFVLTPASEADIRGFRRMEMDLPVGSHVMADAAYTDYEYEDVLGEQETILIADRKRNSRRPHPAFLTYLCQHYRKCVETTFSTITGWMGRRLHAVTAKGFELKIGLSVIAYAILK